MCVSLLLNLKPFRQSVGAGLLGWLEYSQLYRFSLFLVFAHGGTGVIGTSYVRECKETHGKLRNLS
jgi:hypothetical protein